MALTYTWYTPTHTHGGHLFVLAWRLFFLPSLTLDIHPFTLVVCPYSPHLHLICTHSYTWWSPFCSCLSFVLVALTNTWYVPIHACRLFILPSLTLDMHPFIHTVVSFSFCLSFVLVALTYTWYAPTHTLGGLLLLVVPYQVPVETNVQDRKSSQRGILDWWTIRSPCMCMNGCISSAKRTNDQQKEKETTMCVNWCISSAGEGKKKREWVHIKCGWRQKEQTTSVNGCISSIKCGWG